VINTESPRSYYASGAFPLSSLYFLPIYQSFSLIIQFYGKGDYFSLISLEWLGILLGFLE